MIPGQFTKEAGFGEGNSGIGMFGVGANAFETFVLDEHGNYIRAYVLTRLKFVTDEFTSANGQQDFIPVSTDINGALNVIVEGVIAMNWTIVSGAVRLPAPLPEGVKVWIQETRGVL
jgi:hypothetical protein